MRHLSRIVPMLICVVFLSVPMSAQANATLYPSDDLWTDANDPGTVKSNLGVLRTGYSSVPFGVTDKTHLRFDLSSWTTDVGSATKLRLYVTAGAPSTTGTLALWSTADDWNGAAAGLGGETTLTWNNAPAQIAVLDTKPNLTMGNWIEFSGSELSGYLNAQRAANGGDNRASFVVFWQSCTTCDQFSDRIRLESEENAGGTSNRPEVVPDSSTAVTMSTFRSTDPTVNWPLIVGLGALVAAVIGGVVVSRRRTPTH